MPAGPRRAKTAARDEEQQRRPYNGDRPPAGARRRGSKSDIPEAAYRFVKVIDLPRPREALGRRASGDERGCCQLSKPWRKPVSQPAGLLGLLQQRFYRGA